MNKRAANFASFTLTPQEKKKKKGKIHKQVRSMIFKISISGKEQTLPHKINYEEKEKSKRSEYLISPSSNRSVHIKVPSTQRQCSRLETPAS